MEDLSNVWGLIQDWLDVQEWDISQSALARKLGVSPSLVSDWKYGHRHPKPDQLARIAEITGESPRRLLEALNRDLGYLPPVNRSADSA